MNDISLVAHASEIFDIRSDYCIKNENWVCKYHLECSAYPGFIDFMPYFNFWFIPIILREQQISFPRKERQQLGNIHTVCCKINSKNHTRGIYSQQHDGVRPPTLF